MPRRAPQVHNCSNRRRLPVTENHDAVEAFLDAVRDDVVDEHGGDRGRHAHVAPMRLQIPAAGHRRRQVRPLGHLPRSYLWSLRFYPGGGGGGGGGSSNSRLLLPRGLHGHGSQQHEGLFPHRGRRRVPPFPTRWEPTTPPIALSTTAGHGSPWLARIAVRRRSKVEDFAVLRGECITAVCVIGVVRKPPRRPTSRVIVLPRDLPECLGRLLDDGLETET